MADTISPKTVAFLSGLDKDAESLRGLPKNVLQGFAAAGSLAAKVLLTKIEDEAAAAADKAFE